MIAYFRRRRDERMARLIAEAWRDEWDRLLAEKGPRPPKPIVVPRDPDYNGGCG